MGEAKFVFLSLETIDPIAAAAATVDAKKNFFCQPLSNDTTSSSSTVSLFLSLSHSQLSLLALPLSLFLSIMQYLSFSLLFANSSVSPLINRTVSPSLCLYSFLNWSIPGFFLLFSSFKCSF